MTRKTKPRPIKAVFGFSKLAPVDLLARGNAVLAGVYADPTWANLTPPIDKATFKAAVDSYSSLSTEALDGSKKAIAARNHQGEVIIKMLRQLAHWVEATCNEDVKTFLASGFQAVSTTPTKAAPLTESIRKIEPGPNTGQILIVLKALAAALAYELRWSAAVANGTPATWTSQHIGLTRPPTIITGLTPGTSYVFQVRAITKTSTTDWSDPITRICT
jgi:hypothetical protein